MERILAEFVLRSALIAAATAVLLFALRVKTAAARQTAWCGVVACMLLLPGWAAFGPKAALRVLPAVAVPMTGGAPIGAWQPPAERGGFDARLDSSRASAETLPAPRQSFDWRVVLEWIYALGAGVLLARLAIGTVRAWLVVRRAVERGGRLTSVACAAPVTIGWLRPAVILPEDWSAWPQAQLDAVLAHEGEHARRRDPLAQWVALLNRAVFWFHPLAWWLERRISALAEEACDAAVIERGCGRVEYAEYLLGMARTVTQAGARVRVLGMAMPGSSLPRRIRTIVAGRAAPRISRARMACAAALWLMGAAAFTAGAVDRQEPVPAPPAPPPPVQVAAIPALASAPDGPPAQAGLLPQAPPAAQPAPAQPAFALAAPIADAQSEWRMADWRMVVLYFDFRGMGALDRARVLGFGQEYVRSRMRDGELVAIMTETGGVKVREDFTSDRVQLQRMLARLLDDPEVTGAAAADSDSEINSLQTALNVLAPVKGKKVLMYVSIPQDPAVRSTLIDAAIRANVAFMPLNVTGPPGAAYSVAAGDVLQISVFDQAGVSGAYTIRPDGMIVVPMIGTIRAAGLTVVQLEAVIADRLESNGILVRPSVTVGVAHVH